MVRRLKKCLVLGIAQAGLDALPALELLTVVLGKEGAPFALFLLRGQLGDELGKQRATEIPQLAQLIEHQSGISGLGLGQAPFQALQHFLYARGGAFLLLDPILQSLHFVLQRDMGFLQFGAVTKQVQHAVVVDLELVRVPAESQETQL
jgi:hypothetical protein